MAERPIADHAYVVQSLFAPACAASDDSGAVCIADAEAARAVINRDIDTWELQHGMGISISQAQQELAATHIEAARRTAESSSSARTTAPPPSNTSGLKKRR